MSWWVITLIAIENIHCMFSNFYLCVFSSLVWPTLYVLKTLYVSKSMDTTTTVW